MFWIRKGRGSALALPARAALAGARSRYRGITFLLGLPDGEQMRFGLDAPACRVRLTTWRALYEPAMRGGAALADAYVRGEVCVDGDLEDGLTGLVELDRALEDTPLGGLARAASAGVLGQRARAPGKGKGIGGARRLDDGDRLGVACGYFRARGDSLSAEDARVLDRVLGKLALRPGQRLLEIGCGWGHLLLRAAERHDVECLGLTLSESEAAHIRAEARARRLPVKVRVMSHLDLDARAPWDRVVSLGLMGRAGRGDLDRLIDKARSVLGADGLCLIHCVGAARPPSVDPFQQGRLFPGWWVGTLAGAASRAAARGLDVLEVRDLRHDYVATARAWRRDLLRRRAEIARSVGVDDLLVRRWEFYLASLAAGLRSGHLRPLEVLMSRRDRTEDLRPREGAAPSGPRWTNGSAPTRLELAGLP